MLALIAAPLGVFAETKAWRCDACSDSQMQTVARGRGVGTTYVYDLQTGSAVKYSVTLDRESGQLVAEAISTEPAVASFVADISELWQQSGLAPGIYLPAGQDPTLATLVAFDYFTSSPSRNIINDWISQQYWDHVQRELREASLIDKLRDSIQSLQTDTGPIQVNFQLQNDARLVITVIFPDGSQMKFIVDKNSLNPRYIDGSARDGNNNSIPDAATTDNDLATDFLFPAGDKGEADFERFFDILRRRGVPIVRGQGTRVISCGYITLGGIRTLSCHTQ